MKKPEKMPFYAVLVLLVVGAALFVQRTKPHLPRDQPRTTVTEATGMYRVDKVIDGDSVVLRSLEGGPKLEVRLHGIDAPEYNQPSGSAAERGLAKKLRGETIRLTALEKDRYGRTIGILYVGEECVNLWLLQQGLAWHYKRHDDRAEWARAEQEARQNRRGLWGRNDPVAPWDWRRRRP